MCGIEVRCEGIDGALAAELDTTALCYDSPFYVVIPSDVNIPSRQATDGRSFKHRLEQRSR